MAFYVAFSELGLWLYFLATAADFVGVWISASLAQALMCMERCVISVVWTEDEIFYPVITLYFVIVVDLFAFD